MNADASISSKRHHIVATGFGPFSSVKFNPSWDALQHLESHGQMKGVFLHTILVPVCYFDADMHVNLIWRRCPSGESCCVGGCSVLSTLIDVQALADSLNKIPDLKLKFEVSKDPGTYLCGYIYYQSLRENPARTLFVHVPFVSEDASLEDIAAALKALLETVANDYLEKVFMI
ncbi:unnamed protein product [Soboliphyme baturini]|uniref:Peptidase C15, pyroglutamyl peptidase I-like protein n=1 Tax=Soboliphyme baturini TaxID=241478 RepID=A0A183IV88_9BILA|nr:unnamed protein product [Soboliphyme baturini]